MIARPNYLEIVSESGELLPYVQKLEDDGEIDAIIVRGGYSRLSPKQRVQLEAGITDGYGEQNSRNIDFARQLIGMVVPDLAELKEYYRQTADGVMPDFLHTGAEDDLLGVDMIRNPGDKSYAHIDLPVGIYGRDGYEDIRAVSSLSIAAGLGSARFLAKRLESFRDPNDVEHRFIMDYLNTEKVKEIENAGYIAMDGWALDQHPADVVIFPQFDRPTVHQVAADAGRTAVVYSTFIRSHYEAYNNTPQGIARPYLPEA